MCGTVYTIISYHSQTHNLSNSHLLRKPSNVKIIPEDCVSGFMICTANKDTSVTKVLSYHLSKILNYLMQLGLYLFCSILWVYNIS